MTRRLQKLDRALGWFLVLLGCIHNFIAAPLTFDALSTRALWFVSAGLALWFAGFINLLRAESTEPTRSLAVFCLLTNLTLLVFVVSFATLQRDWAAPESVALVGSVVILTGMSIASARKVLWSA